MKKFTKVSLWMMTLLLSFTIFWSYAQKAIVPLYDAEKKPIIENPIDGVTTAYPTALDYNTGSTDGTTKTQASLIKGYDTEDGWFKFDISSLPAGVTINSVTFNGYVNNTNGPSWSMTPVTVDPVTADAATLYADINAEAYAGYYLFRDEEETYEPGWKQHLLGGNVNIDLQNAISQGWFAMGMVSRNNFFLWHLSWDGWNDPVVPYLEVHYHYNITNVSPLASDYNTGSTDGAIKTQVSHVTGWNEDDGWFKFDVSSLPAGVVIHSVTFNGYVNNTNWPFWSMTPCTVDPVTADASTLYEDINAEANSGYYLYRDEEETYAPGWKQHVLGGTANIDLQNALSQDWFAMGMVSRDIVPDYYLSWDGWNEPNPPYLGIDYFCVPPSNQTVDSITGNSARLIWMPGSSGNLWNIEYGETGFDQGTGTIISGILTSPGEDPNYNLSGLSPCTYYDWYIQSDCGSGNFSFWVGPHTFQTANQIDTYPYEQNFDSWNTSSPGVSCTDDGTVPLENCWLNYIGEDIDWEVYTLPTPSSNTGPDDDVTGGGNYLYTEASTCFGATATVLSPVFDFTPLTDPEFSFYYHMYGANMGTLSVDITTDGGTTWEPLWSLSGNQGNTWSQVTLSLLAYTSETNIQFRFVGLTGSDYSSDMAFDQVRIREYLCYIPSDILISNISSNSAEVSWISLSGLSNVEWGLPGFTPGVDPVGTATGVTSPVTMSPLLPFTEYQVYVQDDCGSGNLSNWVGPNTFVIPVIGIFPYVQNFDSWNTSSPADNCNVDGSVLLEDYWLNFIGEDFDWEIFSGPTASTNTGPTDDVTGGGNYLYTEASTCNESTATVLSPVFDFTPLTDPEFSFYFHMYGAEMGTLSVDITTDGGTTWEPLWSLSGNQGNTWSQVTLSLLAYTNETNIQFRFVGLTGSDYSSDMAFDQVRIREYLCYIPSDILISNISSNSAEVSWISLSGLSNVEWGLQGFTPGVDPLGTATGVTSPVTMSSLSLCTDHQVYVQDDCGGGNYSNWVGPFTFQTVNQVILTYPYEQSFDSWNTSSPADNCNVDGSVLLENCWLNFIGEDFDWEVFSGPTASTNTGPTDDVTGGGNYLYTEASTCNESTATVLSPVFDFTPLTDPEFSFYFHMYGAEMGTLSVDITTDGGTTWEPLWSLSGNQGNTWSQVTLSLLAYTNETNIQFRFVGLTGSDYSSDMAFDQVRIREYLCYIPSDILISNISSNSAEVSWISLSGLSNVEWGLPGFTPGVDPLGTATGVTSPVTMSSLSLCTDHQVYVQDDCGGGNYSNWVGPFTFQTVNQVILTYPYEQSFDSWNTSSPADNCNVDGSVLLENCWLNFIGEDFDWEVFSGPTASTNTGPTDDVTGGGNYLYTEASFCNGATATVLSPVFDFTSLTDPEFSFYYHMYGADMGALSVDITTDGGTTWESLWSLSGDQGDTWSQVSLSLLDYTSETNVQFRFVGLTGSDYSSDMAIDQVRIGEYPYISAKVFMEGPFNGVDMNSDLNNAGLIPLEQPYDIEPWNYVGTENVASMPNPDIVDWVLLELREATGEPYTALPDSIVTRKAVFLLNNGQIVDVDGGSLPGFNMAYSDNYYLIVWHRNHLPIMSSVPMVESMGIYAYDFTDQLSKAYENGQKEIAAGVFGMIGGDCDANGIIEIEDKNQCWIGEAGKTGYIPGDWDLNAQVNNPDKNDIWAENLGMITMIPHDFQDCGDKYLDIRDNQLYNTVQIGLQCWVAENLNIGARIDGTVDQTQNTPDEIIEKYCYDNLESNCNTYGGLYQWNEMMQYSTTQGIQGICPDGWYIPTDEEWKILEGTVDSQFGVGDPEWDILGWRGYDAGSNLKSIVGWSTPGGTNSSGFSALPAGRRQESGGFAHYVERAYMWSSTEDTPDGAFRRNMNHDNAMAGNYNQIKDYGESVRCLKNQDLESGEVYNPATGQIWMDRNLGASQVATSSTDPDGYGDLYQWGRATEGHEDQTSGTTSENATTAVPNDGNPWDGLFITETDSPYDWLSPQADTLWQGVNGFNNPCPAGFRIPTEAEWEAERQSWSSNNEAGAFNSVLKLTVPGTRHWIDGEILFTGINGYYWSCDVDGVDANGLKFNSEIASVSHYDRAFGFSVRCIKEE